MHGFYRSSYKSLDDEDRIMATTQFEATDARRAFPCWDEPSFKATYSVTLHVPVISGRSIVALSNTPTESLTETLDGSANNSANNSAKTKVYTFSKTPLMSTYLLAFVVGEFDAISHTSTTTKIATSVLTMPGKGHQGAFCLTTASAALDFLNDYYGVDYPLTKSDLVAIPDFAAGAMENWGLVTYREAKILTDKGTSLSMKKGIARTVCHELAHMWFGNLATMEWWDGLFLNEGFARFMEFKAVNHIFPEWNIWTEFIQSVYSLAMGLDAMKTSHPVEMQCSTPDEINSMFDAISYAKGASVLRMLSHFLNDDTFMKGIKIYLKKYSYANAKSTDLWACLAEGSGVDVQSFVSPWISQVGFPVVTIDEAAGTATMERFLASGPDSNDESSSSTWPCPFSFDDGSTVLLNASDEASVQALLSKVRDIKAKQGYFNLNTGRFGFFRVNYSADNWAALSAALAPKVLSIIDRIALVDDCFALGKSGYVPITTPLDLVSSFGEFGEDDYIVWQEVSEQLLALAGLYKNEPFFPEFQKFLIKVASKQAARLGWEEVEGEPENYGSFRAAVHSIMGAGGDVATQEYCLARFNEYANGGAAVPADLRRLVYKLALKADEKNVAATLLRLYRATSFPEEQQNTMSTLGYVKDAQLHAELLEWALFSGEVRIQDVSHALGIMASSSNENAERAFATMKRDFGRIGERFGKGPMYGIVLTLLSRGGDGGQSKCDAIDEFFETHNVGNGAKRILQAKEGLVLRASRLQRDCDVMAAWVAKQQ
jgi:aminopeptidase N